MEAEMVLLVYVVGVIAGVCPLHLFVDVYSSVYIWKPWPARQQSRQEESPQSCESTIFLSWWATRSHMPSLSNISDKK